jgi:uncharacterized membrane protein
LQAQRGWISYGLANRWGADGHLNLQIDLIAEKEVTKLLQMVRALCAPLGRNQIAEAEELKEFTKATSVETLTQRIDDTLPEA